MYSQEIDLNERLGRKGGNNYHHYKRWMDLP